VHFEIAVLEVLEEVDMAVRNILADGGDLESEGGRELAGSAE
jgi:hypothetical protein